MRITRLILTLLIAMPSLMHAQTKSKSSDHSRTIEIHNDNGELLLTLKNSEIIEFTINDVPVSKNRYDEYQEIIDDFSDDGSVKPTPPVPDTPPTPAAGGNNKSERLRSSIVGYLLDLDLIESRTKFRIKLKSNSLKVNKKDMSEEILDYCLDLFDEVYGHQLNKNSTVHLKRSGENSTTSVVVVN